MINSLSVEETNVIRKRLGLKLIPTDGEKSTKSGAKGAGIDTISVEETNRIRAKLNLKLIPTVSVEVDQDEQERENYVKMENEAKSQKAVAELKRSMEEKKSQLKRRNQLAKGGILDRETATQSLEDWLSEIGSAKVDNKSSDGAADDVKPAKKRLKFKSAVSTAPVKEEKVMTLKDTDVLKADDNDNDNELVHKDTELEEKIKADIEVRKLQTGELVADINRDTRLLDTGRGTEPERKRKLVSLNSLSSDDEISDSERHIVRDVSKPKFKKMKKSKQNARSKRVAVNIEFKPVQLTNEDDDEESELDASLAAKRIEQLKKRANVEPQINTTDHQTPKGEIIQENLHFLDNIGSEPETISVEKKPSVANTMEHALSSQISQRVSTIIRNQSPEAAYSVSSVLSNLHSEKQDPESKDEITLKYTDDDGNELSQKEAFKYMSRKFHGTGLNKKSKLS